MKRFLSQILVVIAAVVSVHAAETTSYTNTVEAAIPDANPTGIESTIEISGLAGSILDVTLSLSLSDGYNGDLYVYLTSENGGFAVLLNRVGKTEADEFGYQDSGMTIRFSDLAEGDVHLYGGVGGGVLTGIWQPDGRDVDPQLVLDSDERTAMLDSFESLDPNGLWTLYIADFAGGGETTLVNWSLTIQTIPEPGVPAMILLGFGAFFLLKRWGRAPGSA